MSINRAFLFSWLSSMPVIVFAENANDTKAMSIGFIIAAIIAWSAAINLCRAGGGWILLGVLIGVFIAVPLTGYAFLGGFLLSI